MTRMLVPTDFSEASLAAVRYAVDMTHAVKGEMLLLHVIEGEPVRRYVVGELPQSPAALVDMTGTVFPWKFRQEIIWHDLYEEAQWKLSALLPSGFRDRFRPLVAIGRPADEIVKAAREQKADLIVMGTEGRKGFWHLLRRSVADKVVRKAPIPVMMLWGLGDAPSSHRWTSELPLREGPGEHTTERMESGVLPRARRRLLPGPSQTAAMSRRKQLSRRGCGR